VTATACLSMDYILFVATHASWRRTIWMLLFCFSLYIVMSRNICGIKLFRCHNHPHVCPAASSSPLWSSRPPRVNPRYRVWHPDSSGLIQLMKANTSPGSQGIRVQNAETKSGTSSTSLHPIWDWVLTGLACHRTP
jgi:hypothetical protein